MPSLACARPRFTAAQAGEVTHRTLWSISWSVCRVEQLAGIGSGKPGQSKGQLHKLRHTYVTRLAAAMVPARTIMELAGHAQLSTTLRYMHLVPGATSAAVAALEAFDQASAELGQDRGRDRAPKTETAS